MGNRVVVEDLAQVLLGAVGERKGLEGELVGEGHGAAFGLVTQQLVHLAWNVLDVTVQDNQVLIGNNNRPLQPSQFSVSNCTTADSTHPDG
jgi:hypothetical protein